jgi:hypothetical protein
MIIIDRKARTRTSGTKRHPVVLRFEGMFPDQLDGYEAHRLRIRGDDGHIIRERSRLNKLLIGDDDWAVRLREEIDTMRLENFADELEELERRKRKKDRERRLAEGAKDPWRASRYGPLRELILTANSEWFAQVEEVDGKKLDMAAKEALFERLAVDWLVKEFGVDVVHARADRDEIAYQIHAVIAPREVKPVNGATRRMLRPSKFAIIEDYEKAQDSVGAWFEQAGLTRGEQRAKARREARDRGETKPAKPRHTRPREWRLAEEARLALLDGALKLRAKTLDSRIEDFAEREQAVAKQSAALVAERRALKEQADALAAREAAVGVKERAVAHREAVAEQRHAEADAVVVFAERMSAGDVDVEVEPGKQPSPFAKTTRPAPEVMTLLQALANGGALVTRALGAFAKLRERLQQKAAEALREKEERLVRDIAEVRAADDEIVKVASALPPEMSARVGSLRTSLAARIAVLGRVARRRSNEKTREQDGEPS